MTLPSDLANSSDQSTQVPTKLPNGYSPDLIARSATDTVVAAATHFAQQEPPAHPRNEFNQQKCRSSNGDLQSRPIQVTVAPVTVSRTAPLLSNSNGTAPSRASLLNILAYWLSLQYENRLHNTRSCPQSSLCYVPGFLCDLGALHRRLDDIYWATATEAIDPNAALAALSCVHVGATPQQVQKALEQFVNSIGASALYIYLRAEPGWTDLQRRYATLLDSTRRRCVPVATMLEQMSHGF